MPEPRKFIPRLRPKLRRTLAEVERRSRLRRSARRRASQASVIGEHGVANTGHIPGSHCLPYQELVDGQPGSGPRPTPSGGFCMTPGSIPPTAARADRHLRQRRFGDRRSVLARAGWNPRRRRLRRLVQRMERSRTCTSGVRPRKLTLGTRTTNAVWRAPDGRLCDAAETRRQRERPPATIPRSASSGGERQDRSGARRDPNRIHTFGVGSDQRHVLRAAELTRPRREALTRQRRAARGAQRLGAQKRH